MWSGIGGQTKTKIVLLVFYFDFLLNLNFDCDSENMCGRGSPASLRLTFVEASV